MLRTAIVSLGLLVTTPALACAGGKCPDDCGNKTAAAETAPAPTPAEVEGTRVSLDVAGMKCGACSGKITAALLETDGVKAATVDHTTGKAEIVFDESKTNTDALVKVVTDLNYQASVTQPGT
ncbi:MAG: heavy-metal-associated domain-containing protein [Alphaproteobacteria bacterium]|nr:heavy-metal-associated domain-containing protein [Alphaproteobacteria bacterium]